jgi:nitroreductase
LPNKTAILPLLNRVSCAQLDYPAPSKDKLALIQKAALRAADHRELRPWRFLLVEDDARIKLGELFLRAKLQQQPDLSPDMQQRFKSLPLRAPLMIVAIAKIVEDPKVPAIEQLLSTGAAVQNMITAAYGLGVGAIWRTGEMVENSTVRDGLGLTESEQIVGFIYLGTPKTPFRSAPQLPVDDYFRPWA